MYLFLKRILSFPILITTTIVLNACGGTGTKLEVDHPEFSRKNISASNFYKPSGTITDTTPTFSWPKTQGATEYLLGHEDTDTSTNWKMYSLTNTQADCESNPNTCSYTPTDFIFSVKDEKVWWVKAQIPGKTTKWSQGHIFNFKQSNPAPVSKPLLPSPEKTVTSLKPTFKWIPVASASQYQVGHENLTESWGTFIIPEDQANCDANQCSFKPTETILKQGGINTWWVRAYVNGAWGNWSTGSKFSIDTSSNPVDLLYISNDSNEETMFYAGKEHNFLPRYTNGNDSKIWAQGIAMLDNGFYLMSKNIKKKNSVGKYVDRYLNFNLFDRTGKSVANAQLDYASHGQDLSVMKISENSYHVYTSKNNGQGIARFVLNTSNIDFNNPVYNDTLLDITFDEDIALTGGTASTPTLNDEKDKFAIVSYKNKQVLYIEVIDRQTKKRLNRFELDINIESNGYYTQGIAMKGNNIYILRGHWLTDGDHNVKKLFVMNAMTGDRIKSYSFSLQNASSYDRIEPEGMEIIGDTVFVLLPTRKGEKRILKLYPLLDTL